MMLGEAFRRSTSTSSTTKVMKEFSCKQNPSNPGLRRPEIVKVKRSFVLFTLSLFFLAGSVGMITNLYSILSFQSIWFVDGIEALRLGSIWNENRPVAKHFLFQTYHEELVPDVVYDRPKLVIHLGPHKTASTTLQTDLTYYQDRLAQDGYVYLGRIYHPYSNGERIVLNRSPDTTIQTYFRDMFNRCWKPSKRECVEDLRDILRRTYRKPFQPTPNLLVSDEAFLKLFDDKSDSGLNENYVLLKEVLGKDWDIVVVLAYRRFYEWLPSAKHQKDKPTTERPKVLWPGTGSKGMELQPLFPASRTPNQTQEELEIWGREHFFSDATIETIRNITSSNFRLKIYHMYGRMSVRTTFLCKVVPHAPFSCRSSQQQDSHQQETRMNARSESGNDDMPCYPSAFFDYLGTSMATLINTSKWERQAVARMLHEQYYKASAEFIENHTLALSSSDEDVTAEDTVIALPPPPPNPWKLPLVCPSDSQLDLLEKRSLELEALYLPKLYLKSGAQHRAAFRTAIQASPDYCWVNSSTLFDKENPWRNYIMDTFGPSV